VRLAVLFLPLILAAEMLKVGDTITPLTLKDQFGKDHHIGSEKAWIVTWDKMTTRHANRFFAAHPDLWEHNTTALIVDVSQTPSGIMNLFVLPRMRSYDHPVLLSYDEKYNITLPYEEEQITVLLLQNGRIGKILFAEDEARLEKILTP
jgi:hypothetical protein